MTFPLRRPLFTPDRVVLLLLLVEALLFLSNWLGWPAWHKGYAVLTCVALVGVALLAMVAWFVVAVILRRQFQFGVRTLLTLVVVVSIPFSWLAEEVRRSKPEQEAASVIRQLGSEIHWDTEAPPCLRGLLGESFFGHVNFLFHTGPGLTDTEMKCLRVMDHIEELGLLCPNVTDAGLENLKRLTHLNNLALAYTNVTDAGLENLRELHELEVLNLVGSPVTNDGIEKLKQALPNCRIEWQPSFSPAPSNAGTKAVDQSSDMRPAGKPLDHRLR